MNDHNDVPRSLEMSTISTNVADSDDEEDLSRFSAGRGDGPSRRTPSMGSEGDTERLMTMEVRYCFYCRRFNACPPQALSLSPTTARSNSVSSNPSLTPIPPTAPHKNISQIKSSFQPEGSKQSTQKNLPLKLRIHHFLYPPHLPPAVQLLRMEVRSLHNAIDFGTHFILTLVRSLLCSSLEPRGSGVLLRRRHPPGTFWGAHERLPSRSWCNRGPADYDRGPSCSTCVI